MRNHSRIFLFLLVVLLNTAPAQLYVAVNDLQAKDTTEKIEEAQKKYGKLSVVSLSEPSTVFVDGVGSNLYR